ncbi:MAG: carboxymuconolactone decarboxylase family protein [Rhodobacteraceae bacterium]|jgi:AhpD family alkylhydroperoxidase|nr:carboxymuconolactone decarboxylase family protein [Paracoccaceae bacterium]MBL4558565.1 carboxymuconolactone decarboxylase family protein [Paracoccaceae bacterium]HBG98765.1 carboxymuconolactone decarboxylase family protein [Paracoccaceae bacterium]
MDYKDFLTDMRAHLREFNKVNPETAKGFGALSKAAKETGPLDLKTKELIACAIAIAVRCEPCIAFHVEALIKAGGTREELADMLSMCVQMGGGPSLMYTAKALDCWDQLTA